MKGQLDHEEKVVKVTVIVNRRTINANEEVILGAKKVPGSVVTAGTVAKALRPGCRRPRIEGTLCVHAHSCFRQFHSRLLVLLHDPYSSVIQRYLSIQKPNYETHFG